MNDVLFYVNLDFKCLLIKLVPLSTYFVNIFISFFFISVCRGRNCRDFFYKVTIAPFNLIGFFFKNPVN